MRPIPWLPGCVPLVLACLLSYPTQASSWFTVNPMTNFREHHTVVLLQNGTVLVAGGDRDGNPTASAELYNPATGLWTNTGSLHVPRTSHTATLLPNGQVLVAGGENFDSRSLASAELYDPATGAWMLTTPMTTNHVSHTATLLPNG